MCKITNHSHKHAPAVSSPLDSASKDKKNIPKQIRSRRPTASPVSSSLHLESKRNPLKNVANVKSFPKPMKKKQVFPCKHISTVSSSLNSDSNRNYSNIIRNTNIPKPMRKDHRPFRDSMTNSELVARVTSALRKYGYDKNNTLLATSLCCDEVNRDLERAFIEHYGDNFVMGGLAGVPFGGVTSFGAMAHHIPDGGSCLIVYGPHVGMDRNGKLGTVERRGRSHSGACCGSACAAADYASAVSKGIQKKAKPSPTVSVDIEQYFIGKMLIPYAERLEKAANPQEELPRILYEENNRMMKKIVSKACGEVSGNGKIALLGGIQINTLKEEPDRFLPINFELLNNKGAVIDKFEEAFAGDYEVDNKFCDVFFSIATSLNLPIKMW